MAVLYRVAGVAGALGYRLAPGARAAVEDNLRHVLPEASEAKRRRVAKQVFRNVACYYAEFIHMPRMDPEQFLEQRLTMHGVREILLPHLAAGKGAIMLSAHIGNAEISGQALIPLGVRTFALTEPIQPPQLSRMFDRIRSSHGVEFVPVGIAGVKRMLRVLREGYVVALMGDRDIEGPKMKLPFFGVETWMPTGPIEVGLRANVPVFPSFSIRRKGGKIEAFLEPPLEIPRTDDFQADVRAGALQFIAALEKRLRADPEQWNVLEKVWGGDSEEPAAGSQQQGAGSKGRRRVVRRKRRLGR